MKVIKFLFKTPVYFYKFCISPWLPKSCRFLPTCSDYCLEAIEKHGILKGITLSTKRILSCHPFSKKQMHDPVPNHKDDAA